MMWRLFSMFACWNSLSIFYPAHANHLVFQVHPGDCAAVLVRDGYTSVCPQIAQDLTFTVTNEVGIILYNHSSGQILNAMHVTPVAREQRIPLSILYPKPNEIVPSERIAFQFDLNLNENSSEFNLCLEMASSVLSTRSTHCVETTEDRIEVAHAGNGEYTATFYLQRTNKHPIAEESDSESIVHRDKLNEPNILVIGETSFTVDYTPFDPTTSSSVSLAPLRFQSQDIRLGSQQAPSSASQGGEEGGDLRAMHLLLLSVRSLSRYQEAEVALKSLIYSRGTNQGMVIHLVVDPPGREYFEALWERAHVQRLGNVHWVFHDFEEVCGRPLEAFLRRARMDLSSHHSGKAGYCRLFLSSYFARLRTARNHTGNPHDGAPGTDDSKPDNDRFCEDARACESVGVGNVTTTLKQRHKGEGSAPQEVEEEWGEELAGVAQWQWLLGPERILTLETDQLMLADVAELWSHFALFDGARDDEVLLAAPENYQPWMHSRPFFDVDQQDQRTFRSIEREREREGGRQATRVGNHSMPSRGEVGPNDYHGYGIICGVMMLDLVRMHTREWEATMYSALDTFRRTHSPSWQPKLNDQDVFNAVLTVHPQLFRPLPCEWNVQIHARINTMLTCMDGILPPDRALALEHFRSAQMTVETVPLNCEAAVQRQVFACERRAKILHFMAQAHSGDYSFLRYYAGFWDVFKSLSWQVLTN